MGGGFINWQILGNPINWLIVVMVLIFVFYAAFVVWQNAADLVPQINIRSPG